MDTVAVGVIVVELATSEVTIDVVDMNRDTITVRIALKDNIELIIVDVIGKVVVG